MVAMIKPVLAICLILLAVEGLFAQSDTKQQAESDPAPLSKSAPRSDLGAISELVRRAAAETAIHAAGSRVYLDIQPYDTHPVIPQIFAEELHALGLAVQTAPVEGAGRVTVDMREMLAYTVLLDNSSYLRKVRLRLGAVIVAPGGETVTWSREFELATVDTLAGEPVYEHRDFLQDEKTWLEDILTPLAITATAVVILILLFTVRGS